MNNEATLKHTENRWTRLSRFFVIEKESVSSAEKLVATLGGLIGITLVAYISYQVAGAEGAAYIIPSMGASAVLLFAVPHGKLSQPWPLIGGNMVSAFVGVTCYKFIPDPFVAAGLAVGLAIGFMHLLSCVHPPGGATALAAVIGGHTISDLGYSYLVNPVLINVIVIFVLAVLFNSLFPWRRYPAAAMMRFTDQAPDKTSTSSVVDKDSIDKALSDMDLVVDITMEDLQRLIQLSLDHARHKRLTSRQIKLGHYYTNGKHGPEWSVRRIIDESVSDDPRKDMVIFRVVEGHGLNTADSCTRSEFAQWATREVVTNGHLNT